LAQCISGIVNDKVIIAQFPVSNNIAELPGLGAGGVVAEKISLGLARIDYSSKHHARKYV